jgi:hypothetical protein
MKLTGIFSLGIAVVFVSSVSAIGPIDRPTPPPCCVDGVCHAHAARFGYFPTRWRVWPGVSVAPMPTVQPPAVRQVPGMPIIEPPTPEEEDRQAPEPIRSSLPQQEMQPPAGAVPRTTPLESLDGRGGATNETQQQQAPGTQGPGGFPQPLFMPRPTTTPPQTGGERSGAELDRPPAPPLASIRGGGPRTVQQSAFTPHSRAALSPASAASVSPRQRYSDDPPPAPPLALGQASL